MDAAIAPAVVGSQVLLFLLTAAGWWVYRRHFMADDGSDKEGVAVTSSSSSSATSGNTDQLTATVTAGGYLNEPLLNGMKDLENKNIRVEFKNKK